MHHAPWRHAVENGDARRVEQLLREPYNAHRFPLRARVDALEIAASRGHADVLDVLLDAAPHEDHGSTSRCLALLRVAGFHGHKDAMWRLLMHIRRDTGTAASVVEDQDAIAFGELAARGQQDETTLRCQCDKMRNAAQRGDLATVQNLLQQDALAAHSMDAATGETAFSAAFASGRRHVCEVLLQHGAHAAGVCIASSSSANDANTTSSMTRKRKHGAPSGSSSLVRRAVEERNAPLVQWLLRAGANAYTPAVDGAQSALSLAAYHSATEIVDTLLAHGARLDASQCRWLRLPVTWPVDTWQLTTHRADDSLYDPTSFLLLAIACYTQDHRFANNLWATRHDLQDRARMAAFGTLPLALAVHRRHDDMVKDLLARGAMPTESLVRIAIVEVDAEQFFPMLDIAGREPQHNHVAAQRLFTRAAQAGSLACMQAILCCGGTQSVDALPAFESAVHNGHVEAVGLILEAGPVPLNEASIARCFDDATDKQHLELLELLLLHPAATASVIQNAFKDACMCGLSDVVALLLAHGVDVNMSVCSGTTFLLHHVLSQLGHGQGYTLTAKLLLEAGATVDLVDSFNETPLVIIERRRSHIRTSTERAQLAFVEDVLQQFGGSYSCRFTGKSSVEFMSSLNMMW